MGTAAAAGCVTSHGGRDARLALDGGARPDAPRDLADAADPADARPADRAPKRLVILCQPLGRLVQPRGDHERDLFSPGPESRALTRGEAPSPLLAALAPIADRIVTIDGIDNLAGLVTGSYWQLDKDVSLLTAMGVRDPVGSEPRAGGPSLDHVAGRRLRPDADMPSSVAIPLSATPVGWYSLNNLSFAAAGPPDPALSGNPRETFDALFRSDDALSRLRDGGCALPDRDALPEVHPATYEEFVVTGSVPAYQRGRADPLTVPAQLDNLIHFFSCDLGRTALLAFERGPAFTSEFPEGSPFDADWADLYTRLASHDRVEDHVRGFQAWGRTFTDLVTRLDATPDAAGGTLLDHTLVLWISPYGYTDVHTSWNLPVVLAGMPDAFPRGQGRHLVTPQRSTGDLFAKILRMLGGTDATFGATGTIASHAAELGLARPVVDANLARPGTTADTPLFLGDLDL